MYDYESLKENHATKVCQTIDEPILVFDYFDLTEVFAAIVNVLVVGVILDSWGLMFITKILILGVAPFIRRRCNKGIYFHFPYRYFGFVLPGILNPNGRRKFSD